MYEHLQDYFGRLPNALQVSGPGFLTPDNGASQLLVRCTHHHHLDTGGNCFPNLLVPFIIFKEVEKWCDVCYISYNAFEQNDPSGPWRQLKKDGFKKACTHLRFCYNAKCSPHDTEIPLATQAMAARIYAEVMEGDEPSRSAVLILSRVAIESIFSDG